MLLDKSRARAPSLLAISDRRALPDQWLHPWLADLAAAGVPATQLREKDLDDRALLELAREARALLSPPALLLVNGRADVALAAGADGVHLPADGVPTGPLRGRFPDLLIGRSTHTLEEVERAQSEGADYVVFGPIFPTPSTAGRGELPGLSGLARAAACGVPVLALGGVTREALREVAAAGAAGAAGIRLFLDRAALAEVVAEARRLWPTPPGGPGAI